MKYYSAAFGGMNVNNLNKVLALIGRKFEEEGGRK